MKPFIASITLLLCAGYAGAVDLKLPEKVAGEVGDNIVVKAETTGAVVKWVPMDKALKLFPVELLKDSKAAVVSSKKANTYRLLAYTSDKDGVSDPQICTVVITNPEPDPSVPVPVPPAPVDPTDTALANSVQSAYGATKDPAALAGLIEFYRSASDPELLKKVQSGNHLFATLATAASSLGIKGKLPAVQGLFSADLVKNNIAATDVVFDDAKRATASKCFARYVSILQQVK